MVTVQHVIRDELTAKPVLIDMLQQDLLNISALAEKLLPKIERILRKKIKQTAVSMAIRRVAEDFSNKKIFQWKFPKNLEVSTRSNIYEIAIKRDPKLVQILSSLQKQIPKKIGMFLSVVDAQYETVFLSNQCNKDIIRKSLKNKEITSEQDNLGFVSVNFEPNTKDIPGIYYRITRALAFNNISIQSFHTIGAEMVILFKNKDLMSAHETIKNLID